MNKLPPAARYFDVNEIWYFCNRWVVRWLYPLPVTPDQITLLSLVMGVIAAGFYLLEPRDALIWGAIFFYGKIFFDNVDGNLARVRGQVSRFGRFFDSLTDFIVNIIVYGAISYRLIAESGEAYYGILGMFALFSCFIQGSYFVFYLVSYTSIVGSYDKNRVDEAVSEEDRLALEQGDLPKSAWILQRLHFFLYGWQDRAILVADRISRKLAGVEESPGASHDWYGDKRFLALASPLCLCTNNMILVVCSLANQLELGFLLVVVLGNAYMAGLQIWKILSTGNQR